MTNSRVRQSWRASSTPSEAARSSERRLRVGSDLSADSEQVLMPKTVEMDE